MYILASYISLFGPLVPHALRGAVTKCRFFLRLSSTSITRRHLLLCHMHMRLIRVQLQDPSGTTTTTTTTTVPMLTDIWVYQYLEQSYCIYGTGISKVPKVPKVPAPPLGIDDNRQEGSERRFPGNQSISDHDFKTIQLEKVDYDCC